MKCGNPKGGGCEIKSTLDVFVTVDGDWAALQSGFSLDFTVHCGGCKKPIYGRDQEAYALLQELVEDFVKSMSPAMGFRVISDENLAAMLAKVQRETKEKTEVAVTARIRAEVDQVAVKRPGDPLT
jgi:hypothetical protein